MVYVYVLNYPPKWSRLRATNMPPIKGRVSQNFTYAVVTKSGNVLRKYQTPDYILYVQEQLTF